MPLVPWADCCIYCSMVPGLIPADRALSVAFPTCWPRRGYGMTGTNSSFCKNQDLATRLLRRALNSRYTSLLLFPKWRDSRHVPRHSVGTLSFLFCYKPTLHFYNLDQRPQHRWGVGRWGTQPLLKSDPGSICPTPKSSGHLLTSDLGSFQTLTTL